MTGEEKATALFETGEGLETEPIIRREMEQLVESDLREGRSVVLLGPRRVGKTTLLERLARRLEDEFRATILDGFAMPSLGSLYRSLCAAAVSARGEELARRFSSLLDVNARLLGLVQAHREVQTGRIGESAWVRELYAFYERIYQNEECGEVPEGSPLAELSRLRASPPEGVLRLKQLVERLAEEPAEQLPELLLAGDPLAEWVLPLHRWRQGTLAGSALMEALFALVRNENPLVLVDEAQALSREEFRPFFDALFGEREMRFVLCADGLAGELLRFVRQIGPARRHPFLQLEGDHRIVVRYLGPLSPEEGEALIAERLCRAGQAATQEAIGLIRERTGGMPYYLQQLLRLCEERTPRSSKTSEPLTPQEVEAAFAALLREKDPDFAEVFEGFLPEEQAVLRRIAVGQEVEEAQESVRRALDHLAERLCVERISEGVWKVTDEVFRAWLARLGAQDE
jgi:energy-coupling factor transporter ATP-binding protein EcfA2